MLFLDNNFLFFDNFHFFIFYFPNLCTKCIWISCLGYNLIITLLNIIIFISFDWTIYLNFCSFMKNLVWWFLTILQSINLLGIYFMINKIWSASFLFKHWRRRSFFNWKVWLKILFTFFIHFKWTSRIIKNLIFAVSNILFKLIKTCKILIKIFQILSA
jgi:hypothetical protein